MKTQKSNIAVIGAGLGGMSAAISLASRGYSVEIFEKNDKVGGKLNLIQKEGFSFDLGPSIVTLPHIFQELFSQADKQFEDYVQLEPLSVHWRNFFEDGKVIDLVGDYDNQKRILSGIDPDSPRQFTRFLNYAQEQYRAVVPSYFRKGSDSLLQIIIGTPLRDLIRFDWSHTMHQSVNRFFTNSYLREIFAYFVKYVGSSAFRAPGFLNLLAWVQYAFGLWYVRGGMYNLARGMERLLQELNVPIHLNTEITQINKSGDTVTGIVTVNGEPFSADLVVSNMEVIPAYKNLLHFDSDKHINGKKFEPSCSGLVIHLGVNRTYPHLAHHNFLFSSDSRHYFSSVFEEYRLPEDPTIYLVAPTRTDPSQAPQEHEIIKILPHIPHLNTKHQYTPKEYSEFRNKVITKCERMGLTDLSKHIVTEHTLTPPDIRSLYYSNQGSIYGVVSDIYKNFAQKAPKHSRHFKNLFFVGGSVNPGGGMPMVVLGGMQVARLIERMFPMRNPDTK